MPPAPHATKKDVDLARIQDRKSARIGDYIYGTARELIRASIWMALFFFSYKTISAFAGTQTTVSAVINAALSVSADRWVAYTVAVLTTGGYIHERRLRKKTVAQLGAYPGKVEQIIDSKRSSSRLLPSGDPRKEDRDAP